MSSPTKERYHGQSITKPDNLGRILTTVIEANSFTKGFYGENSKLRSKQV